MDLLCFEDFSPSSVREFGAYRVTRDEIIAFAREFDPQPFHLDEKAAADSLLGGLAASGWHTLSMLMRLYCDEWALRSASMGGPGVEEARWLRPVRPGDVLSARMRVLDARVSRSRPEIGLVTIASEVLNQAGACVASLRHVNMLGRRGRTGAAAAFSAARAPSEGGAPEPEPEPSVEASEDGGFFGYFEDVPVGRRFGLGSYLFRRDDMVRFARAYDPQPFHVDEDAAARSPFGRLAASGWHMASAFMRKLVDARQRAARSALAENKRPAVAGPSPGFRDLRWLRPVYAGDRLTYASTPIGKRLTRRPGWGLVFAHNVGMKVDGLKAFEFTSAVFYPLRDPRPVSKDV